LNNQTEIFTEGLKPVTVDESYSKAYSLTLFQYQNILMLGFSVYYCMRQAGTHF